MSIYAENVLKVALFLFDVIDFWRWSYLHWVEIVWLAATDEYNFYQTSFRAKAKYERHHLVHKQINFEIAVLFHCPYSRVKKRAKFKSNLSFDHKESFLFFLSSSCII